MAETTAQEIINKVWELAENAETEASVAARSLNVLSCLVIGGDLNDGSGTDLNTDAFYTFTEGIKALICRVGDQAGQVARLAQELEKAM